MSIENTIKIQIQDLAPTLSKLIQLRMPACIMSPPGSSKTAQVMQVGAQLDMHTVVSLPSMEDITDTRLPFFAEGAMHWAYNPDWPLECNRSRFITQGWKPGQPILWFQDEISNAPEMIQKLHLRTFQDGMVGDQPLLPETRLVAAGNNLDDATFSGMLSSALSNRVVMLQLETPSYEQVKPYMLRSGWHPALLTFLKEAAVKVGKDTRAALYAFDSSTYRDGQLAQPTLRSWENVSKVLLGAERVGLTSMERLVIVCGLVGPAAAHSLEEFLRLEEQLPNVADICAGEKVKFPSSLGVQLFLLDSLVFATAKENLHHVVDYVLDNYGPEMVTVYAQDLGKKDPNYVSQAPYLKMAGHIGDINWDTKKASKKK